MKFTLLEDVPEKHRKRIAKQDAVMPKPMQDVMSPPRKRSTKKLGGKTKFHGAFSNKSDAEAKEKSVPGSFIKSVKVRGQKRYAVIEKLS